MLILLRVPDLCQYPLPLGIHRSPHFVLRCSLRCVDSDRPISLHGDSELPSSRRTDDLVFQVNHAAYRIVSLFFSAISMTRLMMRARLLISPGSLAKSGS